MSHIINLKKQKESFSKKMDSSLSTPTQLEWSAPEFEYYPKDKNWLIISGLIASFFLFSALWQKNFLLGVMAVLVFFCLNVFGYKKPRLFKFTLNSEGIKIKEKMFLFKDLKSFWIFESSPKRIIFQTKSIFNPHLQIPLGNQDPKVVRSFLKKHLPEKEQKESFLDYLAQRIGY